YRGLKSVHFFIPHGAGSRPFRCARKQQDDAQEQTPDNHRMAPRFELTPDHLVILPGSSCGVDSSLGSILPVRKGSHSVRSSGTKVPPAPSFPQRPFGISNRSATSYGPSTSCACNACFDTHPSFERRTTCELPSPLISDPRRS